MFDRTYFLMVDRFNDPQMAPKLAWFGGLNGAAAILGWRFRSGSAHYREFRS